MNQHEFVLGCQRYYAENYYEPGNPEDGIWEDCHYPVPRCLGGTETVKLLKEHHAIQGVLQSEEYQRRCFHGWEKFYLPDEYLELWEKWHIHGSTLASQAFVEKTTPEQRKEISRKAVAGRLAKSTPESRSDAAKRAREKSLETTTPEQRSEWAKKAKQTFMNSTTPEQRSEWARKTHETRRLKRLGLI
jgi:hypothetical protein